MASDDKDREEEFEEILDHYAQFLNIHVKRYDLQRYGLDPEDILQDVRIKLWRSVHDQRIVFSQGSYLRRIVNSSVIDQLRKVRRDSLLLGHEKRKSIAEVKHAYSREAARRRMFDQTVGKAVERLIRSRRQVVKLYLLDFSVQDISTYMNWSLDKTRNLLYRGLADLKKSLKGLDAEHEARK